jgi:hypothetical protein
MEASSSRSWPAPHPRSSTDPATTSGSGTQAVGPVFGCPVVAHPCRQSQCPSACHADLHARHRLEHEAVDRYG